MKKKYIYIYCQALKISGFSFFWLFLEVQVDNISLFSISRCEETLKVNLLSFCYNQKVTDSKLYNVYLKNKQTKKNKNSTTEHGI